MRFLKALALVPLLWMLTAPLASADVMSLGVCNFSALGIKGQSTTNTDAKLKEEVSQMEGLIEFNYGTLYEPETCGETNQSTGLIEKGDCTDKVVNEVAEVVSSATPAGDSEGDRIVNLYQGICCLVYSSSTDSETGNTTYTCWDSRDYYTSSLDDCKAIENGLGTDTGGLSNCQLRQWIIAETGMGLLKLYVKQIFTFGSFVVGAIAVATIILNGIRISVAGVSGDISDAKQKITQALSGIVLLFFSALILYSINPDFFG